MSSALFANNIVAYILQIGLVVGLGALVPAALRIRIPRARLLYWQILLVACLALPWIRSWRQEVVVASTALVGNVVTTGASASSAPIHRVITMPPLVEIALWLLAAGIAIRATRPYRSYVETPATGQRWRTTGRRKSWGESCLRGRRYSALAEPT